MMGLVRLAFASLILAGLVAASVPAHAQEEVPPTRLAMALSIPQARLPKVLIPNIVETATAARVRPEPKPPRKTSLSEREFRQTIGRWGGMKQCIGQVRQLYPVTKGALSLLFRISTRGAVVASKAFGATSKAAMEVATCLERHAPRLKFPSFSGSKPVSMQARVVF